MIDTLNAEQKPIATTLNGVLVVCAGAGSGKTRTITARINYLLQNECAPHEIIALTFTNKAAREMRERIAAAVNMPSLPFVGTFHKYCLDFLRTHREYSRIPDFTLLDGDDQRTLLKRIIKKLYGDEGISARQASYAISMLKTQQQDNTYADLGYQEIFNIYEKEKTNGKLFDFDDLLLETLTMLKQNPTLAEKHRSMVRHILVDEYQDTNYIQHALLKQISRGPKKVFAIDSLCVVGDEDQAIYSWRGATIENIVDFSRDFPEAQRFTIQQNYRSAEPILHAANHIIKNNHTRHPKKLWSSIPGTDRVRVFHCNSAPQEAELIASCAQMHYQKRSSCGILYRSHHQSRLIEDALLRRGIPYTLVGGITFYERQEVKDLLGYLRLICNPHDRMSFIRCYNTPARRLGKTFEQRFLEVWNNAPHDSYESISAQILSDNLLKATQAKSLETFVQLVQAFSADKNAAETIKELIDNLRYVDHLKASYDTDEAESRIGNIEELYQAAREHGGDVYTFLNDIALLQERMEYEEERGFVTLMTFHAAKGLEFDSTVICGLEEGMMPHSKSSDDLTKLEEERRLLYVGMTRARTRLILTHAMTRAIFGSLHYQSPCRFLNELPSITHVEDARFINDEHIRRLLAEWYNF